MQVSYSRLGELIRLRAVALCKFRLSEDRAMTERLGHIRIGGRAGIESRRGPLPNANEPAVTFRSTRSRRRTGNTCSGVFPYSVTASNCGHTGQRTEIAHLTETGRA